jgi:NADPH2:quinone reductase
VAWEGRILIIGFASGRIPQIPANIALVKNADIIGFYWGSYQLYKPQVPKESFKQLFRWFDEGKLKPHVSETFDLKDVAKALDHLKQRKSTGKVVLTMGK